MTSFVEQLIVFITDQGARGVFLASALEEIIVPIPSTVIQTGAGFLFLSGMSFDWQFVWVLFSQIVVPTALGATLGSLVIYGLIYWGGMPFIRRFGKYFFLSESKIEKAKSAVLSHKSLLWGLCVLRFLPLLPNSFITAGAGFIRLPLRHYLWTTFLGISVRATYLGIAGWLTGEAYQSSGSEHSVIGMFSFFALGLMVVVGASMFIVSYVKKRKHNHLS